MISPIGFSVSSREHSQDFIWLAAGTLLASEFHFSVPSLEYSGGLDIEWALILRFSDKFYGWALLLHSSIDHRR